MSKDTLPPLDLTIDLSTLERAVRPTLRERAVWRAEALRDRLRETWPDVVIVAVLVAIAVVMHVRGMYTSPMRFDDEGTYTAYAWAVEFEGKLGHYTYWYAHPPLGWIQMAIWNWVTDGFNHTAYAIASVRNMMVLSKIVSVVLLYVLALRLRMTRGAAAGAVLIFSLSPLAIYFTRTALLDNIVTPWLLAAFVLAASRKRGLGSAVGSAVCFAAAVLSKETALLFLPALLLLFWQCSDRRNRKFTVTMFGAVLSLVLLLYPAYALIKNELFEGKGHVSLLWAIKWQLFDRQGSGSIFNPHSTAHAVTTSWIIQDPWMTKIALLAIVPGLVFRRTRAIALAFGIQVFELLRSGYLPYPFVIAMIPFGALTIAGVVDVLWQATPLKLPNWLARLRAVRLLTADRPRSRSVVDANPGLTTRLRRWLRARRPRHRSPRRWRAVIAGLAHVVVRAGILVAIMALVVTVNAGWTARIHQLWYRDQDGGAAAALSWALRSGDLQHSDHVVVDDAFWVDLIRHGFDQKHVIWFTKLDVDPAVKLSKGWKSIDYVMLTYQDEMSVHLTLDNQPSAPTRRQYPTLGAALDHAHVVAQFGARPNSVVIWRVDHGGGAHAAAP